MACALSNTFEYLLCSELRKMQSTVPVSCCRVTHMAIHEKHQEKHFHENTYLFAN